jgi:hypothetical protein
MGDEQRYRDDNAVLIGGLAAGCGALLVVTSIALVLLALFGVSFFGFP